MQLNDFATPNLRSWVLFESFKWGFVLIFVFVLFRFVQPTIVSFYDTVISPPEDAEQSSTSYQEFDSSQDRTEEQGGQSSAGEGSER